MNSGNSTLDQMKASERHTESRKLTGGNFYNQKETSSVS